MIKILCIDDEWALQETLRSILPPEFSLISATHGVMGSQLLKAEDPDIVLLDCFLPDISGIEILKRITSSPEAPPVIMLTYNTDSRNIVKAMRMGAFDYFIKPFEMEQLLLTIKKAFLYSLPCRKSGTDGTNPLEKLAGESTAIKRIKSLVLKYSLSDSPVLITGESGTGKDLIAKIIHSVSARRKGPFVRKNCGAIPESLIESELFGAEKGAFTDAVSRPGSFEQAGSGTLFLDEIGEMNQSAQVRLLNVLENKEITRLGGKTAVKVDVRIISATNMDLQKAVRGRIFRKDLLYRINTLLLHVPPLKNRPEDIPVIVSRVIQTVHQNSKCLHSSAIEKMLAYSWPGNVRELKNVIDRAVVMAEADVITAKDIIFYNSRI